MAGNEIFESTILECAALFVFSSTLPFPFPLDPV
jgi:hypothetical protein